MEEQVFELIDNLIDGRNDFFTRTMQLTPHSGRSDALTQFMMNERRYLEMISRVFQSHSRNQLATTLLTFAMPSQATEGTFNDPVAVVPTQAQIESSLENINSSLTNCAICQDSISSDGCRIRTCGHVYHRSCLTNWFEMNVRCPVCRHDIREGPANQTQPASE